ncbi:hypothetical protein [Legionella micdadei]|uniref:Uncharacterized protein n=1 Tax=Legionella micdadei TaxID=451 RepID=A0A098GH29_LEGMI|nr:hypothetical protein [Legionella micdadei]ARG97636.1 hypothetical protein B6N58_08145 [Legionella micdadei]ARH00050.1 hypothetical protein B6V88_06275 [Legionella micdadei]KTD27723.1 hypothetical protein Lmic_2043 [Legionella micdadei]NSL17708.1 hypothetical protein [Legionella micdadei]CEG60791.1 protein of unknown function [Legionella micdadei]
MPGLTEAQKREIENTKVSEVKEQLQKDVIAKQREMKQKAQALKEEENIKKAQENKEDFDGQPFFNRVGADGRKEVGKIERTAERLIGSGVSAASDWAVEMFHLLSASLELNKALWYDPVLPVGDTLKGAAGFVWDKTIGTAASAVSDRVRRPFVKDEKLAQIRFGAGVDENGVLATSVTKNNKRWPEIEGHFSEGICEWAKLHGFQASPQGPQGQQIVLKDANGVKMSQEKFKELNDNFDTSLEKFLSNRMGMKINYSGPAQEAEEESTPAPRMN